MKARSLTFFIGFTLAFLVSAGGAVILQEKSEAAFQSEVLNIEALLTSTYGDGRSIEDVFADIFSKNGPIGSGFRKFLGDEELGERRVLTATEITVSTTRVASFKVTNKLAPEEILVQGSLNGSIDVRNDSWIRAQASGGTSGHTKIFGINVTSGGFTTFSGATLLSTFNGGGSETTSLRLQGVTLPFTVRFETEVTLGVDSVPNTWSHEVAWLQVPEPGTGALALLGVSLLGLRRRNRRKQTLCTTGTPV